MAELCIFVKDTSDPDPAIDAKCFKRGDVLACGSDGFAWGIGEQSNACFRLVSIAAMSDAQAESLTTEQPGDPAVTPGLLARFYKLDIDDASLGSDFATWIADDSRATPMMALDLSTANAITVQKAAL